MKKLGPMDSAPRTPRAPMVAIHTVTGGIVEIGDQVTNFRGDVGYLTYISRGAIPGKSGKVCVAATPGDTAGAWEYYDNVWSLRIVAMLACGCVVDATTDCIHPVPGVAG